MFGHILQFSTRSKDFQVSTYDFFQEYESVKATYLLLVYILSLRSFDHLILNKRIQLSTTYRSEFYFLTRNYFFILLRSRSNNQPVIESFVEREKICCFLLVILILSYRNKLTEKIVTHSMSDALSREVVIAVYFLREMLGRPSLYYCRSPQ